MKLNIVLIVFTLCLCSCQNLPSDNDLHVNIEETIEQYFFQQDTPEAADTVTSAGISVNDDADTSDIHATPTQQLFMSIDFDSYIATSEVKRAEAAQQSVQATQNAEIALTYPTEVPEEESSGSVIGAASSIDSYNINPAFTKYSGSAPSLDNSSGDAAELLSFSPENKHTYCAEDHTETWSISFSNTGSTTWNSSYYLIFYSGYNWTSSSSWPITQETEPGGTYTFDLPFTVHEDNDIWVTCWYLATGDGKNISDFCYDYYTNSSYGC